MIRDWKTGSKKEFPKEIGKNYLKKDQPLNITKVVEISYKFDFSFDENTP